MRALLHGLTVQQPLHQLDSIVFGQDARGSHPLVLIDRESIEVRGRRDGG